MSPPTSSLGSIPTGAFMSVPKHRLLRPFLEQVNERAQAPGTDRPIPAHRSVRRRYSPIVRMTLLSGRVLLEDSLSSRASISSYFGTVVTSPLGTICTTL
jgi:hypothetical protein